MAEYDSHILPNLQENLSKITLDNITSVSLNTDALRDNFEAIVTILKGLVKRADSGQNDAQQANKDIKDLKDKLEKLENRQNSDRKDLNEKISNTDAQLKTVQDHTDKNTHDIEKLQESLSELRDNQDNLNKSLENSQSDLNAIKEKLDDHDKQIQDLYNRASSSNSGENNENAGNVKNELDNLKQDINDMKKNFDDQIDALHKLLDEFVKKEEFNPFRDQTDNKLTSHQDSIDDLYNMLKDLKSKISDKLDCETFDEHINDYTNIKNIVINLANNKGDQKGGVVQQVISSGAALSTKDANLLKELGQKFPELEALVKKIQKDLVEHSLTFKTFADETHRKIVGTDENLKSHKTESNKRITDLEAAIKSLRDQILNINISGPSTSSGSSSSAGSGDNSAEIRRIQMSLTAVVDRVSSLERELSDLQKLKDKVNQIQTVTNENKQKIGAIEEELNELRALKAKIELLEQMIRDKENSSRDNRTKPGRSTADNISPGSGVTLDQVRHIVDEEIRKLRDEILAMLDAMRAALDKKAEAEDLWKTEASLLERLDQIAGALMKRAQGDKNDTKKALMFLEKKIKEITVVLFGGASHGEDGAILSKKPWNPWSCASCDSKLKDEPRALIDYKNWNKMPPRETSPGRLTQGKFGKGWTKWSETRKTTHEKVRDPFSANSNKGGDTLPEIHRDQGRKEMDSSRVNE